MQISVGEHSGRGKMRAEAEMAGPRGKPRCARGTRVSRGKLGRVQQAKVRTPVPKRHKKPTGIHLINVLRRSVSVLDG